LNPLSTQPADAQSAIIMVTPEGITNEHGTVFCVALDVLVATKDGHFIIIPDNPFCILTPLACFPTIFFDGE
jgi:hypothetical protein